MPRGSSKLYNLSYVGRENSGRKKIKLRDGIMEDIFKESLAVSVNESVRANFLDPFQLNPTHPRHLLSIFSSQIGFLHLCFLKYVLFVSVTFGWKKCLPDLTTTLMILLTFFYWDFKIKKRNLFDKTNILYSLLCFFPFSDQFNLVNFLAAPNKQSCTI